MSPLVMLALRLVLLAAAAIGAWLMFAHADTRPAYADTATSGHQSASGQLGASGRPLTSRPVPAHLAGPVGETLRNAVHGVGVLLQTAPTSESPATTAARATGAQIPAAQAPAAQAPAALSPAAGDGQRAGAGLLPVRPAPAAPTGTMATDTTATSIPSRTQPSTPLSAAPPLTRSIAAVTTLGLEPVSAAAAPLTTPLLAPARALLAPVLAPVAATVAPLTTPLLTPVGTALAPVTAPLAPVLAPVTAVMSPVASPLLFAGTAPLQESTPSTQDTSGTSHPAPFASTAAAPALHAAPAARTIGDDANASSSASGSRTSASVWRTSIPVDPTGPLAPFGFAGAAMMAGPGSSSFGGGLGGGLAAVPTGSWRPDVGSGRLVPAGTITLAGRTVLPGRRGG